MSVVDEFTDLGRGLGEAMGEGVKGNVDSRSSLCSTGSLGAYLKSGQI